MTPNNINDNNKAEELTSFQNYIVKLLQSFSKNV
jgi:hypothetical protein